MVRSGPFSRGLCSPCIPKTGCFPPVPPRTWVRLSACLADSLPPMYVSSTCTRPPSLVDFVQGSTAKDAAT